MRISHILPFAGLFASTALGGLVAVRSPPATDITIYPALYERRLFPAISLGRHDLTSSRQNEVLFDINRSIGQEIGAVGGVGVRVTCVDCRTWGAAVISTTGTEERGDLLGNIVQFFQNPEKAILNAFSVDLKLQLDHVGGYFEFDINARGALSYSVPIYQSLTPFGAAIGDDISIGVVFAIELVFSVTAEVDLTTGFEFSFPENTYILIDPLTGQIKDDGILEGQVRPIPIIVNTGTATVKAALKISLQAGTSVELWGTGFDFQLGVFANLIEYVATISTSEDCALSIVHMLDVNIGAFARGVVKFAFIELGGSAPFVTTILTLPLPGLCITRDPQVLPTSLPAIATSIPLITGGASSSEQASPVSSPTVLRLAGMFIERPTPSPTTIPTITLGDSSSATVSAPAAPTDTTALSSSPVSLSSPTTTLVPLVSVGKSLTYHNATGFAHHLNTTTTVQTPIALITSTVYQTNTVSLCGCAEPLINCPTSLTTNFVVTSTKVLYTTVCTPGAILPTTIPPHLVITTKTKPLAKTFTAVPIDGAKTKTSATGIETPLHFIPVATPIVETIYQPTFEHPVYTLPTFAAAASLGPHAVPGKQLKWAPVVNAPAPASPTQLLGAANVKNATRGGVFRETGRLDVKPTAVPNTLNVLSSATRLGDGSLGRVGLMAASLGGLTVLMFLL